MSPWPFDVRLVMLSGVCVVKPYIDWLKLLKFSRMKRPFAANSSSLLGFGSSASFGGAVMELTSPRKPCNFSITWKTGARTTGDAVEVGAVRLQTPSGALVLPLVLRFHPTVTSCVGPQFSCTLTDVATDGVWKCAAP